MNDFDLSDKAIWHLFLHTIGLYIMQYVRNELDWHYFKKKLSKKESRKSKIQFDAQYCMQMLYLISVV